MTKLKETIERVKNNRDARTLASNFGYLSLLQLAGYVFPILTFPYLAHVIGSEGFGKIAFASAVIVWFETAIDWGFNYTSTREVAQHRDDKEYVSRVFSTVFWGRSFLLTVFFPVLLVMIAVIPVFRDYTLILIITFTTIIGRILFPEWLFQGLERMKYITILNLLIKVVFTASVFVFIRRPEDYILQPVILSVGNSLSGVIAMYIIIFRWDIRLKKIPFGSILRTIKGNTNVFINNFAPNLYNSFTIALLGFIHNDAVVGIYDAGMKFVRIIYQFMDVISRTAFPFLARRIDKHILYQRLYLTFATVVSVVLCILAPVLIKLFFGDDFADAAVVLRIASFALITLALDSVFGINYLLLVKKERLMRNITLTASVIGFATAFPLVYYFNYIGASYTYLMSNMFIAMLSTYFAIKHKKQIGERPLF